MVLFGPIINIFLIRNTKEEDVTKNHKKLLVVFELWAYTIKG